MAVLTAKLREFAAWEDKTTIPGNISLVGYAGQILPRIAEIPPLFAGVDASDPFIGDLNVTVKLHGFKDEDGGYDEADEEVSLLQVKITRQNRMDLHLCLDAQDERSCGYDLVSGGKTNHDTANVSTVASLLSCHSALLEQIKSL